MRVAFLSPCWPYDLVPNGIASYVAYVRGGLQSMGVDAHVLAFTVGDAVGDTGVSSLADADVELSAFRRLSKRVFGRLSSQLTAREGMGVHAGSALEQLDARVSLDLFEMEESFGAPSVIRRYFRKPVVVRLHGPWCVVGPALGHARNRDFWLRCATEYFAIRGASAVSSPSQDVLDRVRSFYRLALPHARVIPNPAPATPPEDLWSEAKCESDVILFVGRFDRVKGADVLLKAFAKVVQVRPKAQLLFVGPDPGFLSQDGTVIKVERFIREQIPVAAQRQIILKGAQSHAQIAEYRRRASLTVVASRYENFPMTVLEAMASGSPLVACRTGGIPEIVEDGQTGLLFAPEDFDGLATQIVRLLSDRELAGRLGAAARAEAEARFSPAAVAAQTHAFYAETIARCGGG